MGFSLRLWFVLHARLSETAAFFFFGLFLAYWDFWFFLCSFSTEQTRVTLYMTAIASLSKLVQKPTVKVSLSLFDFASGTGYCDLCYQDFPLERLLILLIIAFLQVFPQNGLEVHLSGSAAAGNPPTTLSPADLILDWTCMAAAY